VHPSIARKILHHQSPGSNNIPTDRARVFDEEGVQPMSEATNEEILEIVREAYERANIRVAKSSVRRFPGETIVVVEVNESDLAKAVAVASELDSKLPDGFVTVKRAQGELPKSDFETTKSLADPRVNDLVELLNARSRTSEQQPSLRYIRDAAQTLNIAISRRHHLIFGRRGVGKTALMLEAKRLAEQRGAATFWMNIQIIRQLSALDAFLTIASRLCDLPDLVHNGRAKKPLSVGSATGLRARIKSYLDSGAADKQQINRLIPELQQMFQTLGRETEEDIYLFIDDIHYLAVSEQPQFLDMIHSITRDNRIWLKVAGIKHQTRWFTDNPPTGLQTGHDAAIINLDVTLEQPARAKEFLLSILRVYTDDSKIGNAFNIVSREALDRLVLASGGVPRDFLVLTATAIQAARQRSNSRTTGVQDVNESAGKIAQVKLQELEDDAAKFAGLRPKHAMECAPETYVLGLLEVI
jgi:AAA ATPase domain